MGFLSKLFKATVGGKLDPIGRILGINKPKPNTSAQDTAATKARQDAEAQLALTDLAQKQYQQAMLNMQKEAANLAANNRADLSTDTVNNVVAGGTAVAADDELKKKKLSIGAGISSQLGINV